MNEEERRRYLAEYEEEKKKKGIPFFPDAIFKDAVVMLIVFIVLVALAYFFGSPLEARADPADATYMPRPEWYFLFVFQLLKYFPGNLEVIGVIIIPAIAVGLMLALPVLDRSPRRHFRDRLGITGLTALALIGVVALTVQALREQQPLAGEEHPDKVAALYATNCAACHGPSLEVPPGTDLHAVIAQGNHEGMPAWGADLSVDEIDALVGFITTPNGWAVFRDECAECHQATDLAELDPFQLQDALDTGFAAHQGLDVPNWSAKLDPSAVTALVNFLIAPDGQRLFAANCSTCHGTRVTVSDETEVRSIIMKGGRHRTMPSWSGRLPDEDIVTLARYVVNPATTPGGDKLFAQNCSSCHGKRVPAPATVDAAYEAISVGAEHETMPIWGDVLTNEQIDALVTYTIKVAEGAPEIMGQRIFSQNCSMCHGDFGEGGPLPADPTRVLAPISAGQYLDTHDNATITAIVTKGQPDLGMSPFGVASGGPLSEEQIVAVVAFVRSWETNPPVEALPAIAPRQVAGSSQQIWDEFCAQCHALDGSGAIGPSLVDPTFQDSYTDSEIVTTIQLGHPATAMIAWGQVLTTDQIEDLVGFVRTLAGGPTTASEEPTFVADVKPLFDTACSMCHGTLGGWDASGYQSTMTSGAHAPVIVPGDPNASILLQKLLGAQEFGGPMPPSGGLSDAQIQMIEDWISNGAPES
ncbi:MAG: hypothetical protein GWP04_05155 [Gammaproteobacteria bacterium]|nr:hypothetical protein [Gammaproteobacteria bacterium]